VYEFLEHLLKESCCQSHGTGMITEEPTISQNGMPPESASSARSLWRFEISTGGKLPPVGPGTQQNPFSKGRRRRSCSTTSGPIRRISSGVRCVISVPAGCCGHGLCNNRKFPVLYCTYIHYNPGMLHTDNQRRISFSQSFFKHCG